MRWKLVVLVAAISCGRSHHPSARSEPTEPSGTTPLTCSYYPQVSGVLHTSVADIALDQQPVVWSTAVYKQDVDAADGGCVRSFTAQVGDFRGPGITNGCALTLTFETTSEPAGLRGIGFSAGSLCPGFYDAVEATYGRGTPYFYGGSVSSWYGGGGWWSMWRFDDGFAPRWPDGLPTTYAGTAYAAAERGCIPETKLRFPGMAFTLTTQGTPPQLLHVDLSDVVLSEPRTMGNPDNVACQPLATSCGASAHDGGDGWCVPVGTCSPGHPIDPSGACSPFPRL